MRTNARVLGRAEKWKNAILKYVDVDYYDIIYIKQESIEKNGIFTILAGCSLYRVHGTQNDRLELTVSAQKLVLKNMHQS